MKLGLILFVSIRCRLGRRSPDSCRAKIEVTERSGGRLRATLVSAGPDAIVVREASGERLWAPRIPYSGERSLPHERPPG
jgi:hypothetical protein